MIYVSVNNQLYPAEITGRLHDNSWNNRASKEIKMQMPYAQALELFVDDVDWSIVELNTVEVPVINGQGEEVVETQEERFEHDNSEYSIAGDVIDHRNGYVSVKMGKPTAEELLAFIEEAL
jgi:hypothetical protein